MARCSWNLAHEREHWALGWAWAVVKVSLCKTATNAREVKGLTVPEPHLFPNRTVWLSASAPMTLAKIVVESVANFMVLQELVLLEKHRLVMWDFYTTHLRYILHSCRMPWRDKSQLETWTILGVLPTFLVAAPRSKYRLKFPLVDTRTRFHQSSWHCSNVRTGLLPSEPPRPRTNVSYKFEVSTTGGQSTVESKNRYAATYTVFVFVLNSSRRRVGNWRVVNLFFSYS